MLRNRLLGRRQFGICLVILIVATGWVRGANGRGSSRQSSVNSRKKQLRQEAQQMYPEVETQLTQILENVNKNRRPADQAIAQAETTLKDNKRHSLAYEDTQRAGYFLLQAWMYFYQDNLSDAMKYSVRACKLDSTNQDAWVSQAVFCLLNDKQPRLPRVKKTKPQRSRSNRGNDVRKMPSMAPDTSYIPNFEGVMKKGILEFDLKMLASGALKERFDKIDYKKGWEEEYGYDPNQHTLCLLFWRSDEEMADEEENVNDSDDISKSPEPVEQDMPPRMMPEMMPRMMPGMEGMSGMPPGISEYHLPKPAVKSVKGQQQYFGRLFRACREHEQIKFVQINTDLPETAKEIAEKWYKNPDAEENPRLVFVAEMDIDPKKYADLNEVGPLMLIVNTEGKVTYAGPAATFAPAFILTALTGVELDLEKIVQVEEAAAEAERQAEAQKLKEAQEAKRLEEEAARRKSGKPGQGPMPGMMPEMLPPGMRPPGMPVPQPKKSEGDPNALNSTKAAPGTQPAQKQQAPNYRQLSPEQDTQAQKDLEGARTFMGLARKGPSSYKNGVKMCRDVIERYPRTIYEQQARELLRRVPEHKRSTYGITDEELGL